MRADDCGAVEERLREHVAGELTAAERAEVEAHLAACAACAAAAARERKLAALLDGLAPAPAVDVPLPALPDLAEVGRGRPAGRIVRIASWAAVAAAVLLVATRLGGPNSDSSDDTADGSRIRRYVDDRDVRPDWDERTLALAAGVEAVATLRPADGR